MFDFWLSRNSKGFELAITETARQLLMSISIKIFETEPHWTDLRVFSTAPIHLADIETIKLR